MHLNNLTGEVFGRLTVLSRATNSKSGRVRWNCVCKCGTHGVVTSFGLISGDSKSCGCLQRDVVSNLNNKGGITNHPLYPTWRSIKARCVESKRPDSKWYFDKGVRVCDEWLESFDKFASDMGDRPVDENGKPFEIDRIDSDKGYSPENCRWVSSFENKVLAVEKRDNAKHSERLNRALWSLADSMAQLKGVSA